MPRTGTTLSHPKIGYVNVMPSFHSRHLALNSPLDHFNGDNARLSTRRTKTMVTPMATWLSLNYSEHNPSYVQQHTLPSQPSQLLITQFHLHTHILSTSLAAQTQTTFSMLQIKTIPKHISTISILLLHPSFITLKTLARRLTTLNEETTQHKHTYVTTIFLANNKLSPSLNNNKISSRLK